MSIYDVDHCVVCGQAGQRLAFAPETAREKYQWVGESRRRLSPFAADYTS